MKHIIILLKKLEGADEDIKTFAIKAIAGTLPHDRCAICGEKAEEEHHLATKRYDPALTVSVCKRCHAELTIKQKLWQKTNEKDEAREEFTLRGLIDLLNLKAEVAGDKRYKELADSLSQEFPVFLEVIAH